MGKFYHCIQSYGPSFMTKFCSALYLVNLLTYIFAKLNLCGGVSCMPAALLLDIGKSLLMPLEWKWTYPNDNDGKVHSCYL